MIIAEIDRLLNLILNKEHVFLLRRTLIENTEHLNVF